ncbi:hypothetical protein NQD34_016743 [Periophthalmus magnuspinnatus]|nr:hypothetical protein NQD34_016743 [Periophthalmus magnuspinnatus]
MKCLEHLLLGIIVPVVRQQLDPLQFAYKARRGTEDAVACLLHLLLEHLDSPGTSARILFADFSSAFNTIQRHRLISKLNQLQVPSRLIQIIHSFLSNRQQAVRVNNAITAPLTTNTGAPQGCVLSPFLYTLYTNDCTSPSPGTVYIKYADDTAILGLLSDSTSLGQYQNSVSHFTTWCKENHLQLNLKKTQEMTFGPGIFDPTSIDNITIDTVEHFKYLGLTIDHKLTFDFHTLDISKRCNQRLSVIRKLKGLHVSPHLLLILYTSIIQPVLLYCSPCFLTMLTVKNRNSFTKITHLASKIIGLPTPSLSQLNSKAITRIAQTITQDHTHPLHRYFTLLPSGRRYRTLRCNKARFKNSLIPTAIINLNNL